MEEKILETINFELSFDYISPYFILRDINIDVYKQQKVGLIGESGSGKTSFANSILQLFNPEEVSYFGDINFYPKKGCVFCENDKVSIVETLEEETEDTICYDVFVLDKKLMRHLRGYHISMIFQDPFSALNPVKKVGVQVEEVVKNHNKKISKKEVKNKVLELFSLVELSEPEIIYNKYPHQLSGGQLQRVCIAISIANQPELIIADEPTTALDQELRIKILDLLNLLINKSGSSLILITHDIHIVKNFVDYIYILYAGEILEEGNTKQVLYNPLHPYTQMLLETYPDKTRKGKKLNVIPGQIPDLSQDIIWHRCIFYDRCNKKLAQCGHTKPEMVSIKGQKVKCLRY